MAQIVGAPYRITASFFRIVDGVLTTTPATPTTRKVVARRVTGPAAGVELDLDDQGGGVFTVETLLGPGDWHIKGGSTTAADRCRPAVEKFTVPDDGY